MIHSHPQAPIASRRLPTQHAAMSRTAGAARLPLDEEVIRPTFRRERAAMRRGLLPVAGCDEAGRGPLAGPVVAAAVILDPKRIPRGLDDSKKLLPAEREKLYARICAHAEVAIAFGSTARIDRDNIRQASLWALAQAVLQARADVLDADRGLVPLGQDDERRAPRGSGHVRDR